MAGRVLAAFVLLLILPDSAWAFGPATHVFLAEQVLNSLFLLPEALVATIRSHPLSFLYGSVAADISFAKKYVPDGRHCHYWPVAEEIFERSENARMRAAALGYLGHLAGDTIAHNTFIPRRLLLTSSTKGLGHSYWEARMDAHLANRYTTRARKVVMDYDHSEADALFDRVLSGTIFSFETNRRIFRGMIRIQDNERWKTVFDRVVQTSRWDLEADTVEAYLSRAFDYMVDYLRHRQDSTAAKLDPTGEEELRVAKRIRRNALREGSWTSQADLRKLADHHFPLPDPDFGYWERRGRDEAAEDAYG